MYIHAGAFICICTRAHLQVELKIATNGEQIRVEGGDKKACHADIYTFTYIHVYTNTHTHMYT